MSIFWRRSRRRVVTRVNTGMSGTQLVVVNTVNVVMQKSGRRRGPANANFLHAYKINFFLRRSALKPFFCSPSRPILCLRCCRKAFEPFLAGNPFFGTDYFCRWLDGFGGNGRVRCKK
jgi:hypothetical protein